MVFSTAPEKVFPCHVRVSGCGVLQKGAHEEGRRDGFDLAMYHHEECTVEKILPIYEADSQLYPRLHE